MLNTENTESHRDPQRKSFSITDRSCRCEMRGTSGTPRHTKRSRYRCSLPGLAGFAGLRRTEPEVPRIGSRFARKRLPTQSSTATRAKKEKRMCCEREFLQEPQMAAPVLLAPPSESG